MFLLYFGTPVDIQKLLEDSTVFVVVHTVHFLNIRMDVAQVRGSSSEQCQQPRHTVELKFRSLEALPHHSQPSSPVTDDVSLLGEYRRQLSDCIDLCAIQLQGAAATVPNSRDILVPCSKAELKSVYIGLLTGGSMKVSMNPFSFVIVSADVESLEFATT